MKDLFEFWKEIGPTETIHPADRQVFERLAGDHQFSLKCLPLNFSGPLKSAKVVLLYLSPGFGEDDEKFATTQAGQQHMSEQRTGVAMLSNNDWVLGHQWQRSRLKFLLNWEDHLDKIAMMNIGAYHSKDFKDHDVLASLPSSRAALNWAQEVLFPEAEAGKRVVICMRAAHYWGLRPGRTFGISLYAPHTTRSGHMKMLDPTRELAIESANAMLAK